MEAEGLGKQIAVVGWTQDNEPAVDYMVVCDKCYKWYEQRDHGMTEDQVAAFFNLNNNS